VPNKLLASDTLRISQLSSASIAYQDYLWMFADSTKKLEVAEVLNKEFSSYRSFTQELSEIDHTDFLWVKFVLTNDILRDTFIYLNLDNNKKATVYQLENRIIKSNGDFGIHLRKDDWPNDLSPGYYPIHLRSGSTQTILSVRTQDALYTDSEYKRLLPLPYLLTSNEFQSRMIEVERTNKGLHRFWYIFLGIFAFLFLFTVVQFLQHKEISFFYYSLYILFVFLFYSDYAERFDGFEFFFTYFDLPCCLFDLTSYLIMLIYPIFMEKFLDLKKNTPRFYKFFILQYPIIIVVFLVHLSMYLTDYRPELQTQLYYNFRTFMSLPYLVNIFIIALLYRNRMGLFIVLGSLSLALGSIIAIIAQRYDVHSIVYTQCGVLIECFFFSSILGYRQKMIQDEKANTQALLIDQLKKNNDLTNQLNNNLKVEVDKKTLIITEQTEAKLRAEYKEKLATLESQSLRSRMNPHFIFNCLNSIDNFVLNNQALEASEYLTKFSKLMRNTLDYSKRSSITLDEELKNLGLYVQMEQLRFNKKLDFKILNNQNADLSTLTIPPLTLQPFVENAIWHGIMHSAHPGELIVSIDQEADHYLVAIDDNGIGRERAGQIKSLSATKNKSYGMKITAERLKLNESRGSSSHSIEVIDKTDELGLAIGTKVILRIPLMIKEIKR